MNRKSPIIKICEKCGREFRVPPSLTNRRFCSNKCRRKEWVTKICQACGKEFKVTPSRKDTARFCSRTCADKGLSLERWGENNPAWIGGKIKVACEICGKERELFKSHADVQRFCSMKCRGVWWTQQQQGKNNTCWRDSQTTVICEYCGESFDAYVYGSRRFCSQECSILAQVGPDNPNWLGGKSFEPYPATFNETFKEKIRQRDGYTCAICKLSGKSVHHINYVKEDTVPENCITLCKSCHMATNFNRDYWLVTMMNLQEARIGVES